MKKAKIWIAVAALLLILIRPEDAIAGSQRAMGVWCASVAPALFPFLALMPLLTGPEACAAYNLILGKFMNRIFHLPGSAAAAVVIGLISGSPGGAIAIRRVNEAAPMSKMEIRQLSCSICGVSPAFLILGVGQGLYGSAKMGFALGGIQLAVQLGMLIMLRGKTTPENLPAVLREKYSSGLAIGMAVENVLSICGYMVLFSAVSNAIAGLMGEAAGTAALLLADLPTGLARLAAMQFPGKLLLQGAAIGFGGLCICMQNLDVLRPIGVSIGDYLAGRMICGGIVAGLSGLVFQVKTMDAANLIGNAGNMYVISLFAATIFALPGMIYFSNKLFLNIQNKGKIIE